jgi:hypothetical protein
MNQVISFPQRSLPSERLEDAATTLLIQEMANHIFAGVLGGLSTASDQDIIAYLYAAPQRYHYRLILDHYDRAVSLAKHMRNEAEISTGEA